MSTNWMPLVFSRLQTTVLRSRRSNLATTRTAPERFACATALRNSGRLSSECFVPVSTSWVGANDITAVPVREHANIRLLCLKAKARLSLYFCAYAVIGNDFLLLTPIIRFCRIIPNGRSTRCNGLKREGLNHVGAAQNR